MKPSEPPSPDPEKKFRSKVLSRIAIWLAILLIGFGGLSVWDRRDYSRPLFLEPDPFPGSSPNTVETIIRKTRFTITNIQSELQEWKSERTSR